MSSLDQINAVADYGYISFDTLPLGLHKVDGFGVFPSSKSGKDRNCVRVELEGGYVILPERFDKMLDTFKQMNTEKLFINYTGRGKGNRVNIKFEEKTE